MKKKYLIVLIISIICTISYIYFTSYVKKPKSIIDENTKVLMPTNHIFFNSFGENDFTCTGMTYDSKNDSFWILDAGFNNDRKKTIPRLIEIDNSYKDIKSVMYLNQYINEEYNLQGLCYDESTNTFLIAVGDYVIEINKFGEELNRINSSIFSEYKSNGVAIDDENIWVLCYEKYLVKMNRQGELIEKYSFNFKDQDQIFIKDNVIYCTVGADYSGDENYVLTFNIETKEISNKYQLRMSNSVEGIVLYKDFIYIANDGKFHNDIYSQSYISEYYIE